MYPLQEPLWRRFFKSPLGPVVSGLVLFFVIFQFLKLHQKYVSLRKDLKDLNAKILTKQEQNESLDERLLILSKEATKEKIAKEKLNLKREGEEVVVIVTEGAPFAEKLRHESRLSRFQASVIAFLKKLFIPKAYEK